MVLLQEDKYKSYYNELKYALAEYERVTGGIVPTTASLLKPHLQTLELKLRLDPSVEKLTVGLRTKLDPESSTPKRLLGYTEGATGVAFSEGNAVISIKGVAADDAVLRVGDILLAVNGESLKGSLATEALLAPKLSKLSEWKLTVARQQVEIGGEMKSADAPARVVWSTLAPAASSTSTIAA